jgi:outer membrane lipoprotein-sorting protein
MNDIRKHFFSFALSIGYAATGLLISCPVFAIESALATKTALQAPPTFLGVGETLTLTATVSPAKGSAPTGTVNFLNGLSSLGTASLNKSGLATLKLAPKAGEYAIKASYSGSPSDLASISAPDAPVKVVDLAAVLARLDASAAKFQSALADLTWDHVQTAPIPDSDTQQGTVLVARKGSEMQIAVHLKTDNGKPMQKDLAYAGGVGKLYEANSKQMDVYKVGDKSSELETYFTLGFGGSGKDLDKNWQVSLVGSEAVNGIPAAKLLLIPRDPKVAKSTTKVLLWIDMDKGVALKQLRFDPSGNYVTFTYQNIRLNVSAPSGAFDIKPPAGTTIVNH